MTLICLLWSGVLALRAANYYVATNGTDNTGCTDWANAARNIQYAVDLAIGAGDTVWVSNGSYRITNQITITNNITVMSTNGYSNTLVYADWPIWTTRCFYVSRTGVLDGFTISNGHFVSTDGTNGGAGALLATGTILNCYFINNVCSNGGKNYGGGGVYIKSGTVSNCTFFSNTVYYTSPWGENIYGGAINILLNGTVLKCTMRKNQITTSGAGRGGGIMVEIGGSSLISNCTFDANIAGNCGSAIFTSAGYITDCVITNHAGNTVVTCRSSMRNCLIANNTCCVSFEYGGSATNCVFDGNRSSDRGVARLLFPENTRAVLERCTFSNNLCSGGVGGGAVAITNYGILRNCLIHHNTNTSSSGRGGGVFLGNAAVNRTMGGLFNCTIVNNYSTNEGGGVAMLGPSNYIVNCVIAGNSSSSGNYPNVFYQDNPDANMSNFYYSCAITTGTYLAVGQGNITNDPVLAGAGNWRLSGDSPCVNKGTNISWMTNSYDLDGRIRIRYGVVDMGAYERINEGAIYNLW